MANEEILSKAATVKQLSDVAARANTKIKSVKTELEGKIDAKISSAYKAAGTVEFAALPTPAAENLGNVYNVSDAFTTDDKFVEGAGSEFPAGTNVVVIKEGEDTYKYDALSGFVDLSNLVEKEQGKALSTNDFTNDAKSKLDNLAEGATKVEASDTAGNIKINGVEVPVVNIASDSEIGSILDEAFAD